MTVELYSKICVDPYSLRVVGFSIVGYAVNGLNSHTLKSSIVGVLIIIL